MALCECGCGHETALAPQTDKAKGWIKGQPKRFLRGHQGRIQWGKATVKGYRMATGRQRQTLHRRRAEKALGKPLPPGAEVHHADGSMRDDAPLVICQDRAYHMLLHKRMRERGMVYPCVCGHEKGDHQTRIGQRGNYTPCCVNGCRCDGFRKYRKPVRIHASGNSAQEV
jgi:hypothetical protein